MSHENDNDMLKIWKSCSDLFRLTNHKIGGSIAKNKESKFINRKKEVWDQRREKKRKKERNGRQWARYSICMEPGHIRNKCSFKNHHFFSGNPRHLSDFDFFNNTFVDMI